MFCCWRLFPSSPWSLGIIAEHTQEPGDRLEKTNSARPNRPLECAWNRGLLIDAAVILGALLDASYQGIFDLGPKRPQDFFYSWLFCPGLERSCEDHKIKGSQNNLTDGTDYTQDMRNSTNPNLPSRFGVPSANCFFHDFATSLFHAPPSMLLSFPLLLSPLALKRNTPKNQETAEKRTNSARPNRCSPV